MRRTIERTGTIDPADPDWLAPIHAAAAEVAAEAEAAIRADRTWRMAEAPMLSILGDETSWRVHCVLDTEEGLVPILPGDPVPCGVAGCPEPIEPIWNNRCGRCGLYCCPAHLKAGFCAYCRGEATS